MVRSESNHVHLTCTRRTNEATFQAGSVSTTTNGADIFAFIRYMEEGEGSAPVFATVAHLGTEAAGSQEVDLSGLLSAAGLSDLDSGLGVLDTAGTIAGAVASAEEVVVVPGQALVLRMMELRKKEDNYST